MDSDTELFEDEEEILVYVEFEGFVNNNIFTNGQLQLDMVGIDTDHPIMQIDGRFYEGTYEDVVGTFMFFEKDDKPIVDDPIFDQTPTLKYFGKTRKVLKMQRVFVKQRTEVLGDSEHSKCIPNKDTIKQAGVPPMYQSQALSFWKDIRDNRIDALCAYLEKQKIREEKKSQGIALDSESDEDNPFAMYKYKEEHKNEKNLENNNTNLVVDPVKSSTNETVLQEKGNNEEIIKDNVNILEHINPEPSTSKASNFSIDTNIKKCKSVKVIRKKKERIVRSKSTKKQKKKSTIVEDKSIQNNDDHNTESTLLTLDNIPEDSITNTEMNNLVNIVKNTSNITDDVETDKDTNKNANTDEKKMEIVNDLVDDVDKKHKKLLKREAKMKELSEKLKSVAEEFVKANINQ
ncbi:probable serine/threonine-protein kinase dyrk1 isoform X1 [Vespa mandarinia]|uniref:probable serine/threonine-protein kinase dyrk1 isoform X1 n=2 Tax=Vespa mandarinia TaxID=7446 RepID=UPI001622EFA5|nr:probable serine/threonine-protein kinase dyrk1 isoform X1 [Vespa mandarinia]XP_035742442.1 probable serine/threonine-protein kinase dyrk1 isoform X1 [Vespa mandarinia]